MLNSALLVISGDMEQGMPQFKASKMPVESYDESLEDIERQASLLFEEFLRLPQPSRWHAESPNLKLKQCMAESNEADEDDMVPDSMLVPAAPGSAQRPSPATFGAGEGPSDPTIQRLALQMQHAGDALYKQYERKVEGTQNSLVSFVLDNAASLTYDRLSKEIDNLVGKDRNWSNFALAMCVGKRVVVETSRACSGVSQYFSRYISQSYGPVMQQAGGVETFVRSRGGPVKD